MAQQIIPASQLIPKFQRIGRCNNYDVLQSIPCSPECKIVGPILLDHSLSYALIATADVPAVYLQQFWKTVSKVPDIEDTIRFKLDIQEIVYTVDMFRDTLHLSVKTPKNPFIAPVNIETMFKVFNRCLTTRTSGHDQTKINILQLFHAVVNHTNVDYAALLWWDFMNCVSQKKNYIQYPCFTKLIIADLMKKFTSISLILEEDYHSIKDDIPLVSVYTTRNVTVRGMLIPDALLTDEIRAIDDYKDYETVFVDVDVLMNQPQLVIFSQGMHRSTPRAHRTPTLTSASPQVKKRKKSDRETRIELRSHIEHLEVVFDDDANKEEKKDEKDDDEMGSLEIRTEKMQTPIPTTSRSPRKNLSSDKNIDQELMDIVSPSTANTSQDPHKQRHISNRYRHLPSALRRMFDQVLHEIVPQLAEKAMDDLIENNLKPCIATTIIEDRDAFRSKVPDLTSQEFNAHAPKIIEELFKQYVQNNVIQVNPTTTTSINKTSSIDLQKQLYIKMKRSLQDRANDTALWEVLKHDDAPPEGEKRVKRHTTFKRLKSAKEFQKVNKRVPTIFERARMEAALNDMLSNQFRNAEEYAYHLEQATSFMENQIVWESRQEDIRRPIPKPLVFYGAQRNPNKPPRYLYNKDLFFLKNGNTEEKKYILSLHKTHAERFLKTDLEEKINRWVHKEFKNFNEDARLSIQHWKDS
ncbi:hypothetical protein Tco_1314556 [Tanacetum coccineum]